MNTYKSHDIIWYNSTSHMVNHMIKQLNLNPLQKGNIINHNQFNSNRGEQSVLLMTKNATHQHPCEEMLNF